MLHPVSIVFLLLWTSVFSDDCIVYDFESDYENLFTNNTRDCSGVEAWQLGEYKSIGLTGAAFGSEHFIEPTELSCASSFSFHMNGGILEVNVYMVSKSDRDQVTVFVNELKDDDSQLLRGTATIQPTSPSYSDGWNVIRINLPQSFSGYVSFFGMKSEGSIVLIDSFRFYSQSREEDCHVYDIEIASTSSIIEEVDYTTESTTIETDASPIEQTTYISPEFEATTIDGSEVESTTIDIPELETTTDPSVELETTVSPYPDIEATTNVALETDAATTVVPEWEITTNPDSELEATTSSTSEFSTTNLVPEYETTALPESINPTTASPNGLEQCVTYNFDHDFDSLFTDDHDLCRNFTTWSLKDYTNAGIDTDNARGHSYLQPTETLSCISAFPIRMSPNGLVEVNVYIEPKTNLDHIIVLVKQLLVGRPDAVAGSYIYEPSVTGFITGWNVLRVPVQSLTSFDGYLLFLGISSEGATVLVDSFRYIPPWTSEDDESCAY